MNMPFLYLSVGGFLGANARYWLGVWINAHLKPASVFPWSTFFINVTGSFLLGLYATLSGRYGWHDHWRLLVAVGFLGAYTTFSTFSYESLQLLMNNQFGAAARNIVGSVILGLLAVWLGVVIGRWIGR